MTTPEELFYSLFALIGAMWLWLVVIPYLLTLIWLMVYADRLGRSFIGWGLLGFTFTPFLALLGLLAYGKTYSKRKEEIEEEEMLRANYRALHK